MRNNFLLTLAVAATMWTSNVVGVLADPPAPAATGAPAATKANVDQGKTMRKVLAKVTLTADEKTKVDKIMADPTLTGTKRRDAVRAVLGPASLAQFNTAWDAAHGRGKKTTPAASPSK